MGNHYSKYNVYGFKHCMLRTILFSVVVLLLCGLIGLLLIGPWLYPVYYDSVIPKQGEVGAAAKNDTPTALSIEDMRNYNTFTILIDKDVLRYDDVKIGQETYYYIKLPSEEAVIAKIDVSQVQETEGGADQQTLYKLPIGTWRKWDCPKAKEEWIAEFLVTLDYYVDMTGDNVSIMSEEAFCKILSDRMLAIGFILTLLFSRIIGVRKERYAPAIFAGRDPLLPRNDMELWCASTFAIWAHFYVVLEGWPLVTGSHKNKRSLKSIWAGLREQWDIHSREEGLRMVHSLIQAHENSSPTPTAGWDLCRATQLLGMMHLVGMIDRDTMDIEFSRAGREMQSLFHSWEELAESYLLGYEQWQQGVDNAYINIVERRSVYERLKKNANGPYAVPWNLDLIWELGKNGKAYRTITRKLLSKYYRIS